MSACRRQSLRRKALNYSRFRRRATSPPTAFPRSANDTTCPPATMKWSSVRTSTSASAAFSDCVRSSSARRLRDSGWMVVREDRGCVVRERRLDDLPRIDAGLGERPGRARRRRSGDAGCRGTGRRRPRGPARRAPQIIPHCVGRGERVTARQRFARRTPGKLDARGEPRMASRAEPARSGSRREHRGQSTARAALRAQFKRARAAHAGPRIHRDQLGIGQRTRPLRGQSLARPLAASCAPVGRSTLGGEGQSKLARGRCAFGRTDDNHGNRPDRPAPAHRTRRDRRHRRLQGRGTTGGCS